MNDLGNVHRLETTVARTVEPAIKGPRTRRRWRGRLIGLVICLIPIAALAFGASRYYARYQEVMTTDRTEAQRCSAGAGGRREAERSSRDGNLAGHDAGV